MFRQNLGNGEVYERKTLHLHEVLKHQVLNPF